jgi:oleate hydratase
MAPKRNPNDVQAWLIGGGIASLAAAVHLVKQAKVPANQVHILDVHHASGGAMENSGNPKDGYIYHTGAQPYFQEECVTNLLRMVPSPGHPETTLLESIKEHERYTRPMNRSHTRAVIQSEEGLRRVETHKLPIGAKLRMDLIRFIFDNERMFDSKKISDVFDATFFESGFWTLWSTT